MQNNSVTGRTTSNHSPLHMYKSTADQVQPPAATCAKPSAQQSIMTTSMSGSDSKKQIKRSGGKLKQLFGSQRFIDPVRLKAL